MQKFFENFTFFDLKWKNFFLLQEMVGGGGGKARAPLPPPFLYGPVIPGKMEFKYFPSL